MTEFEIQDFPVADSPNNDAFEAIVELYYQVSGYITSAGKWFWIRDGSKKQRGYQDIDVLAIGCNDLFIVSVTTNLDDKVNTDRQGVFNQEKLDKLNDHFSRIEKYLGNVDAYKWMIEDKQRKIRRVVAYNKATNKLPYIKKILSGKENNIALLSSAEILKTLNDYVKNNENLKIQNQMLRTIQIINHLEPGENSKNSIE